MGFLIVVALIGLIPATIAQGKGYSFFGWWLYGAALFIVALPHAIVLKPNAREIENRQLASGDSKKCPFCAEVIKLSAVRCPNCQANLSGNGAQTDKPIAASAPTETRGGGAASVDKACYCGECGTLLSAGSKFCNECGARIVRALPV